MKRTLKLLLNIAFGLLIVFLFVAPYLWNAPILYLEALIDDNSTLSALAFIALMFIATVVAPVAALPLVPALAPFFGPFWTAIYAIIGWSLGGVVAFLLARHIGRPLLSKVMSFQRIEQFEAKIPANMTFWWLVALRMIIPVDILSYAVGFVSTIPLSTYTLATVIGITPFAFIFSYGGEAFRDANYTMLLILVVLSLCIFTVAFYSLRNRRATDEKK